MEPDAATLCKFLANNEETEYIRLQWVDYSGVLRCRFVPVALRLALARGEEEYHIPQISMITPISTAPKSFPTSSRLETWMLRPDWTSLRCCGFEPTHASVMCFVLHKEARDTHGQCPRMNLYRANAQLEKALGARIQAGFEVELTLLNGELQPLRQLDRLNSYQTTAGLRGGNRLPVQEVLDDLRRSGIQVHHYHTETHDQLEFAFRPQSLIDAIDTLLLAQETIRTVFVRHDIRASMAPKTLLDGPTNGIHMHLSASKVPSSTAEKFISGILGHMAPLCAIGMANYDSYARTTRDAAGAWIGFGTENRDLPVRKVTEGHWEFRMMDGTCNPYLFASAVLMAGLQGLGDAGRPGTWTDCRVFPHTLDEEGRAAYGLHERMPASLQAALGALKTDGAAKKWMSEELLSAYVAVKEREVDMFKGMTDEQRRLRFLEYF